MKSGSKLLKAVFTISMLGCITTSALAAPATGSALWLNASVGVQTDANGNVTAWADQSGNNHNATLVTGAATLTTSGINNLSALNFNGGTAYSVGNDVLTSQQFSIFAVVTDNCPSCGYREVISNWNAGTGNSWTSMFFGASGQTVRFSDAYDKVGTLSVLASPFILSGVSGTNSISIQQNSTVIASNAAPLDSRNLSGEYVIGRQGALNDEYWQGTISEIIVYNRELTAAETSGTIAYLNDKYLVAAVPEPETYAMLLAGLGLMGAVVRRKQK